jgi:hypothetical protein
MFEHVLNWEKDEISLLTVKLPLIREDFLTELLRASLQKAWIFDERRQNRNRDDRNLPLPPWRRRDEGRQDENREPTAQELEIVCGLGFEPYLAGYALRMARFSTDRAVNILLGEQESLLAFIERDNQEK